jgi:putative OPT family oligopeptide transporter
MNGPERELTLRALVLGSILSAVLGAANAYLGLFAGMTVSASIPAAVVSMAILRRLRGTLLENNLVQTAASAGESAAAGAIFTLPAVVLLGAWQGFDYWVTTLLVLSGGVLGVLFTIPLKHALVEEGDLPFPEGQATAEVLRAGHGQGSGDGNVRPLLLAAAYGAAAKLLEGGLLVSRASVEVATYAWGGLFYFGSGLSPALAAVGSIVGLRVSLLMLAGGLVNWLVFVPLAADPASAIPATEAAWATWSASTRFLGVGAMTLGGLWTLVDLRHALVRAVRSGTAALRGSAKGASTTRDLPPLVLNVSLAVTTLMVFFVLHHLLGSVGLAALLTLLVLVLGFLFSSVAAYMAGLVGSSNNPVSGVTIATILLTATLLVLLGVPLIATSAGGVGGPAVAVLLGSIICTAAAIGGDNMQDLKTGHLVGAHPARQQIAQLLGVVAAALVMAPVLDLLSNAYGFGARTPEHPSPLRAPQATLMASVAKGVYGGDLPWRFVLIGAGLAAALAAFDFWLGRTKKAFRVPVLAVAVGLYLPVELSVPIALGAAMTSGSGTSGPARLLTAAGLITGEALLGVVLAGVVSFAGPPSTFFGSGLSSGWIGGAVFVGGLWLLRGRRLGQPARFSG